MDPVAKEDLRRLNLSTEELEIAISVDQALSDSSEGFRFDRFQEFHNNKDRFKNVIYKMRERRLVYSKNNEIKRATDSLID